ncbi:MAG: cysteine desulfurase [Planctomycetaceae bacterium]|nr:cysteine desulfurase [Planctomycetaceae bacterium]
MSNQSVIYLDHNATTPMRPEVIEEVVQVSREAFGNPGSRHGAGRTARRVLESCRERIAEILGARPGEVIFTSGGTESINLALRGLCTAVDGWIAAPEGEHPATEEAIRTITGRGLKRLIVPLDQHGHLQSDAVDRLPWEAVRLVSLLLAHNETGVVQKIEPLAALCRQHRVPLHLDAVQAVGKIAVNFRELNVTALSLGAHKFYGPRGVGALLLREGTRLQPLLVGGHQEQGRRAGTECVALVAGMTRALELWHQDAASISARLIALRDQMWTGLRESCQPVWLIGDADQRLPNTLNLAFHGCDGDGLLVALDLAGVYCSLGSTCASGTTETAPILRAMQVPPEWHRSCLRLSVGIDNTPADITEAIKRISQSVNRLRSNPR